MDIRQDLATFDSKFGLPPANLHVVNTIARSATSLSAKTAPCGSGYRGSSSAPVTSPGQRTPGQCGLCVHPVTDSAHGVMR